VNGGLYHSFNRRKENVLRCNAAIYGIIIPNSYYYGQSPNEYQYSVGSLVHDKIKEDIN